jgi:molecular chaperone Hsp33
MLSRFTPREREDMTGDDGMIGVTCEFSSTHRVFDPKDFDLNQMQGGS